MAHDKEVKAVKALNEDISGAWRRLSKYKPRFLHLLWYFLLLGPWRHFKSFNNISGSAGFSYTAHTYCIHNTNTIVVEWFWPAYCQFFIILMKVSSDITLTSSVKHYIVKMFYTSLADLTYWYIILI